jgi:hypothetical protein
MNKVPINPIIQSRTRLISHAKPLHVTDYAYLGNNIVAIPLQFTSTALKKNSSGSLYVCLYGVVDSTYHINNF